MDIEVYSSHTEDETFALGAEFSHRLQPGDVVAFYGDLGTGKTEFIKGICQGLHVREIVTSPTFNLVNEYRGRTHGGRDIRVLHIDLYRIARPAELVEIGMQETIVDERAVKLIEWAEVAAALLPGDRYDVQLAALDDESGRRIEVIHRSTPASGGPNGAERVPHRHGS